MDNKNIYEIEKTDNKRRKVLKDNKNIELSTEEKCYGCYPINQPNQLAHMDYGGCLYPENKRRKVLKDTEETCENETSSKTNINIESNKLYQYAKETCNKAYSYIDKELSSKCSGCFPTFQPNQTAHMDYGGCLYTDI